MKLRDSELGFCVCREKARYCVWVKYDKQKVVREVEINPVTGNGYYPLDRTYKILGEQVKRTTWDDEWHVSSTKVFSSVNQIPNCENFSYVDEEAYDGKILKTILKGNSLEQIARQFQHISLSTKEYQQKRR
jgi:hypothetical protein